MKGTGLEPRAIVMINPSGFKGWFYVIQPKVPWETCYFADDKRTAGRGAYGEWLITIDTYDPNIHTDKNHIKDRDDIIKTMLIEHGNEIILGED